MPRCGNTDERSATIRSIAICPRLGERPKECATSEDPKQSSKALLFSPQFQPAHVGERCGAASLWHGLETCYRAQRSNEHFLRVLAFSGIFGPEHANQLSDGQGHVVSSYSELH